LAAFDDLGKAGARHAAEIAPGHDHEVRVESRLGIHRRPQLSDHLLDRDAAAAGAGFRRKGLVFNMGATDARLNVFPHGVMRADGIAVAGVGIREDRDLHAEDNFRALSTMSRILVPESGQPSWSAEVLPPDM
jgi:hypothetical protein